MHDELETQANGDTNGHAHPIEVVPPPAFNPEKITRRLESREVKPSLSTAIAYLEQCGPWTTYAFRLGILQLIEGCAKELHEPNASAETVDKLKLLVESLSHLPFDP